MPAERQRAEHRARVVEAPVRLGSRLSGTCRPATSMITTANGTLMQEDQPPAHRVDQHAAQERPDQPGDAGQRRPQADRAGAVLVPERGLDEREAARGEQRAADALQGAGRDELAGGLREPAQQRGRGEPADADDEHLAAAVAVTQRAAEQDERGQRQRVRGDGPLQARTAPRRSSRPIEGSATWTAVASRNAMPDASTVTSDQPAAGRACRVRPAAARRAPVTGGPADDRGAVRK